MVKNELTRRELNNASLLGKVERAVDICAEMRLQSHQSYIETGQSLTPSWKKIEARLVQSDSSMPSAATLECQLA